MKPRKDNRKIVQSSESTQATAFWPRLPLRDGQQQWQAGQQRRRLRLGLGLSPLGPVAGFAPAGPPLGRERHGPGPARSSPVLNFLPRDSRSQGPVSLSALFGRRAGVARRLESVSPAARALLAAVARDHLSGSDMPAAFLDSLHLSQGADTWNRYASVLGAWFSLSARQGLPAVPADPARFACWLASAGGRDRGCSQAKIRCPATAAVTESASWPVCRRRISFPWSSRTASWLCAPRPLAAAAPGLSREGTYRLWAPMGAQPYEGGQGLSHGCAPRWCPAVR